MRIRDSLNHHTYIEHSRSILYAADKNLELLKTSMDSKDQETRVKTLGLYRSTMLLYAVSLELILKARALFEEKEWLLDKSNATFKEFLSRWNGKKTGHDFFRIIEHYAIKITIEDQEMLENFKEFTGWAGRYPYPKDDSRAKKMEKKGRNLGTVGSRYKNWAHAFIEREIKVMTED